MSFKEMEKEVQEYFRSFIDKIDCPVGTIVSVNDVHVKSLRKYKLSEQKEGDNKALVLEMIDAGNDTICIFPRDCLTHIEECEVTIKIMYEIERKFNEKRDSIIENAKLLLRTIKQSKEDIERAKAVGYLP